jgi:hypothetical protein
VKTQIIRSRKDDDVQMHLYLLLVVRNTNMNTKVHSYYLEDLKGRDNLIDPGADAKLMLKYILNE